MMMIMMMMVKVIGLLTLIVDLDHPAGCNGLIALSLCLFTLLIGPTPPKAPRLMVLGLRQERYMDEFQCDGSHLSTSRFESSSFRKMSEEFTKVKQPMSRRRQYSLARSAISKQAIVGDNVRGM